MKGTWHRHRLEDLLTRSGEVAQPAADAEYKEITTRLWGKGVLERGRISGAAVNGRRFIARKDQFIASRIDARNGAMGVVPESLDGALVTNDFPLFEVNRKHILPQYMGWLCRTPVFVDLCSRASEGTTNRVRLKEDEFLRLEIQIPDTIAQQRIVARIEAVQQKLQATDKLRSGIEDQLQSLFLSLHNDTGTSCKLGDLIELYELTERIQSSESYPQVGVRGFGGGLFPKVAVSGTETTYKSFNRLYEDAIVLSQVKGWEGAIAICPKSLSGMFVSPEYRTFRCKPNMASPSYMQEVVRSQWFWKYLQEATRGVGARRERVRPEKFLAIELHMPSLARQEIIVSELR